MSTPGKPKLQYGRGIDNPYVPTPKQDNSPALGGQGATNGREPGLGGDRRQVRAASMPGGTFDGLREYEVTYLLPLPLPRSIESVRSYHRLTPYETHHCLRVRTTLSISVNPQHGGAARVTHRFLGQSIYTDTPLYLDVMSVELPDGYTLEENGYLEEFPLEE